LLGNEFKTGEQVWEILDSVFEQLNTQLEANNWYMNPVKSSMKTGDTMGEYLARYSVHIVAMDWNDTLKITNLRNIFPAWWQDETMEHVLHETSFTNFCATPRKLEQDRSAARSKELMIFIDERKSKSSNLMV
jgi:hypothetical protein